MIYRCAKCRGSGEYKDRLGLWFCDRCQGKGKRKSKYDPDRKDDDFADKLPLDFWEVQDFVHRHPETFRLSPSALAVYDKLISIGSGYEDLEYPQTVVPASRAFLISRCGLTEHHVRQALKDLQAKTLIVPIPWKEVPLNDMREWLWSEYVSQRKTPPGTFRIQRWPNLTPSQRYSAFDESNEKETGT